MHFFKSTQNFIEKEFKKFDAWSYIILSWTFNKSGNILTGFFQKDPLFLYWSNICTLQTIGERPCLQCFIYIYFDSIQNKITFFKRISWNFTRRRFFNVYIIYDSFYGLSSYMIKRKFAFHFEFFLYYFYTLVKNKFFNNGVNCVIPWWHFSIFGPTKEIWRV